MTVCYAKYVTAIIFCSISWGSANAQGWSSFPQRQYQKQYQYEVSQENQKNQKTRKPDQRSELSSDKKYRCSDTILFIKDWDQNAIAKIRAEREQSGSVYERQAAGAVVNSIALDQVGAVMSQKYGMSAHRIDDVMAFWWVNTEKYLAGKQSSTDKMRQGKQIMRVELLNNNAFCANSDSVRAQHLYTYIFDTMINVAAESLARDRQDSQALKQLQQRLQASLNAGGLDTQYLVRSEAFRVAAR